MKSHGYAIKSKSEASEKIVKPASYSDGRCGVSLKFFHDKECFSKWQKSELKAFSAWVMKIAARSKADITRDTNKCHSHRGAPPRDLPDTVSQDETFYSIKVKDNTAWRVFGFFGDRDFHIIWLDRSHSVHKLQPATDLASTRSNLKGAKLNHREFACNTSLGDIMEPKREQNVTAYAIAQRCFCGLG